MTESRETEPKVVLENAGCTMSQKTANAVAGISWKLTSFCGQTTLEIMHAAVTACPGIALTSLLQEENNYSQLNNLNTAVRLLSGACKSWQHWPDDDVTCPLVTQRVQLLTYHGAARVIRNR